MLSDDIRSPTTLAAGTSPPLLMGVTTCPAYPSPQRHSRSSFRPLRLHRTSNRPVPGLAPGVEAVWRYLTLGLSHFDIGRRGAASLQPSFSKGQDGRGSIADGTVRLSLTTAFQWR